MDDLTTKCQKVVRSVNLTSNSNTAAQKHILHERPDIIVSTPAKILAQLKAKNCTLRDGFETLIIDEADLIFSFGYENDLKEVLTYLPPIYQVRRRFHKSGNGNGICLVEYFRQS